MTKSSLLPEAQNDASLLRRNAISGTRTMAAAAALLLCSSIVALAQSPISNPDVPFLPSAVRTASTVPTNGDVNPYGVAFIGSTFLTASKGPLQHGDILVSNYNNKNNLQGTGTTIIDVPANGGAPTVFFQGTAPLGLSTGLGTLQYGFILVGNLPTKDGTAATAQAGSILVINNKGKLVESLVGPAIDGPWDMTVVDNGDTAVVYVANALNGTVSRITLAVNASGVTRTSHTTIASGYMHQGDPAALFDAPTGLVYDRKTDRLFVASTLDNLVFAVPNASTRTGSDGPGYIVYDDPTHLHGALALAEAPNGHLLVTNNDVINSDPTQPSEIVEFTKDGNFVKEIPVDPNQGGSFGLAVHVNDNGTATLAAVDDNALTLTVWTLE
jgi:hypothetical protein